MSFNTLDQSMSASCIDVFGESVEYHANGVVSYVKAVIDKDRDVIGYETGVSERRTEMRFLSSTVPHIKRGDLVIYDDTDYEIQDVIEDDGTLIRVTVR